MIIVMRIAPVLHLQEPTFRHIKEVITAEDNGGVTKQFALLFNRLTQRGRYLFSHIGDENMMCLFNRKIGCMTAAIHLNY